MVTIGKYVTPNHKDINGNGIEPDLRRIPGALFVYTFVWGMQALSSSRCFNCSFEWGEKFALTVPISGNGLKEGITTLIFGSAVVSILFLMMSIRVSFWLLTYWEYYLWIINFIIGICNPTYPRNLSGRWLVALLCYAILLLISFTHQLLSSVYLYIFGRLIQKLRNVLVRFFCFLFFNFLVYVFEIFFWIFHSPWFSGNPTHKLWNFAISSFLIFLTIVSLF